MPAADTAKPAQRRASGRSTNRRSTDWNAFAIAAGIGGHDKHQANPARSAHRAAHAFLEEGDRHIPAARAYKRHHIEISVELTLANCFHAVVFAIGTPQSDLDAVRPGVAKGLYLH